MEALGGVIAYFPNIVSGGQSSHSWLMIIARFTTWAARVLNIGHVPQKRMIPISDTKAKISARGLHKSTGKRMPQNDKAAAMNPKSENAQKVMAMIFALRGVSLGNSHERAGSHLPPFPPRSMYMSAPIAPPWPSPCISSTPVIRISMVCVDMSFTYVEYRYQILSWLGHDIWHDRDPPGLFE